MVQSDKIPEGDHSINTVQKKGAAVSQSSGGKIPSVQCTLQPYSTQADAVQIPQACLVTGRRMVRATSELESKHSYHGRCDGGDSRDGVERQCGEGGQIQDAGTRSVLSQSVVSEESPFRDREGLLTIRHSWSKQIIEHERAQKAKEQSR